MKEHVYNLICDVCRRKRAAGREPAHALLIADVLPQLEEGMTCTELHREVGELCAAGRVRVGNTMTDWYSVPVEN